jgi:uncharacterized protein YwgA
LGDPEDDTMASDSDRSNWALVIIGSADYVEGATRLQKYAFLGSKRIKGIIDKGFYSDWIASKYGPFSPNLAADMEGLVQSKLVIPYKMKNEYGYFVNRFALSDSGREKYRSILVGYEPFASKLKEIVTTYHGKELMDVLHDVYTLYPEFAYDSVIRPRIAKKAYESDSYLNPELDSSEE